MSRLSLDTNTPIKVCLGFLIVAIVGVFSLSAMASKRADVAWQEVQNGAFIVDVRTQQEFKTGHLENAVNMPLSNLAQSIKDTDRSETIVVYCRSGSRASKAKRILHDMGFHSVFNGGGLEEMQASKP